MPWLDTLRRAVGEFGELAGAVALDVCGAVAPVVQGYLEVEEDMSGAVVTAAAAAGRRARGGQAAVGEMAGGGEGEGLAVRFLEQLIQWMNLSNGLMYPMD